MNILVARIVLLVVAVLVWGYGYRFNDANIRLAGIGVLLIALMLRFLGPRRGRHGSAE
ncbi:MAG: hypothetical protein JWL60_569 [Gemmatimonadetes bacterium]|jgi:hypothetical protein|nr:hypothetical protein [Gemmatimonadota bacterium]